MVLHALSALGSAAAEAWMIGDSRYDREAARDAGVHFIGLRQDGDARVDRLADLARLTG